MKVKRLKRSRKMTQFYVNSFGFREPIRVLVDGTFCQAALTTKMYLQEQVPQYLGVRAQLVTTKCCVDEIDLLGDEFRGAKLVAKRFEQRKCRCRGLGGGAETCLMALIGESNPEHYVVATQDRGLKEKLRRIPGVPVLSISFGQLSMGKPSQVSLDHAAELNYAKVAPTAMTPSAVSAAAAAAVAPIEAAVKTAARPIRKRKRKGPNPLSIKKKNSKKKGGAAGSTDGGPAKPKKSKAK
mmetsp:Transcript_30209/g.79338  ORF Transcript_30209/g.79338 Transcript_30209/m.79338 type:complete len:240 (+) Transcript_30209:194-913(+)|eukprot:CAMPEP_0182932110 /NCGR_PEP_ID=MMETSP0105_2-20130417/30412_1 /TAXON_ID=81532 ORGANISM="Acanthoeca-like sp., Strain 10tr" /NCGR_SAMPLE_ID=MMETSP0105_2 /ASSEMBLY_ACC=CAM_ASM_000205 /LENGTH=239 /DNA_ID=CAMNT_0025070659 /DNA_START=187 /DNA_END=906 /DNA_ORIENTATION=+